MIYCNLPLGNSQDQPAFSLFPRDRGGSKVKSSAEIARPMAVLSLHLTARSAGEVENCAFGVGQLFSDSANDKILIVRHGPVEGSFPERFLGRADSPLTVEVRRQAEATARAV